LSILAPVIGRNMLTIRAARMGMVTGQIPSGA
jgi:hypothetical protein